MAQTAVEWLVEQMEIKNPNWLKEEIEQAKEMEKQQIIDACNVEKDCYKNAEQYYKETFNK